MFDECDNCEWFDRDEICDECRKRKLKHRHTVTDENKEDQEYDEY